MSAGRVVDLGVGDDGVADNRLDAAVATSAMASPPDLRALFLEQSGARRFSPGRFIVWLDEQRFGPLRKAVRAELDALATAHVDAVAALDVTGATPLARWQRLSAALQAAGVALWLDVKPKTIALDAAVWIGAPLRGVASPAAAVAVERLLRRSGLSPAAVAAAYEEVAGRARATRNLWIETQFHLRRARPWNFPRPTTTKKKKPAKKQAKKQAKKKKKKKTQAKKKKTKQTARAV